MDILIVVLKYYSTILNFYKYKCIIINKIDVKSLVFIREGN
jgi:hypothetical protein